jgi:hypothetical protein
MLSVAPAQQGRSRSTLRTNGKGVLAALLIAACSGGSGGPRPPAHACGEPGETWQRCAANPVVRGWQDGPAPGPGAVADPELIRVGDTYHLWAGALGVDGAGEPVVNASYTRLAYGIVHAVSAEADGAAWETEPGRELTWDPGLATGALGLINGPEVVRAGDEYRLYYGAWGTGGTAGVPAGSCAYVWQDGAIAAVDGVFGLDLATRKVP